MKAIFAPGLRAVGLFGPLGRALLIVAVFALALASALGIREAGWGPAAAVILGVLGAYLVCALVLWGQLGMSRISRTVATARW